MSKKVFALGIDQGIANCGYGIVSIDEHNVIQIEASGTIKTKASLTEGLRLALVYDKLSSVIEGYPISIIGIEKLFFNPVMVLNKRNKSASMMQTNMATGLLHYFAATKQIEIKEFVPGTIKKEITGSGKGTKDDILKFLRLLFPEGITFKTEHEADAVAIAITAGKGVLSGKYKGFSSEKIKKQRKKKKPNKMEVDK